jgi:hypothetical protein
MPLLILNDPDKLILWANESEEIATVFPDGIITASVEVGVPAGDQLSAVFQSPLFGPTYVLVAPSTNVWIKTTKRVNNNFLSIFGIVCYNKNVLNIYHLHQKRNFIYLNHLFY